MFGRARHHSRNVVVFPLLGAASTFNISPRPKGSSTSDCQASELPAFRSIDTVSLVTELVTELVTASA